MAARVERMLLLAPDSVARAAAARARRPEERWLLRQPRRVRESFARDVLRASDRQRAEQIWMLRQSDAVRASYLRDVLEAPAPAKDRPPSRRPRARARRGGKGRGAEV